MDPVITPYAPCHDAAWRRMRIALFSDEPADSVDDEARRLAATGRLKGQPFQCLIALDADDRPRGFIELTLRSSAEGCDTAPVAYVESWYVEPEVRARGFGRALMQAAMDFARDGWACREIASDTQPDNARSAAAHAALGFTEAGTMRCFSRPI